MMKFISKGAGSISLAIGEISPLLTVLLALSVMGAKLTAGSAIVVAETTVPEPGTIVLLGGLVLIGVVPWRRIFRRHERNDQFSESTEQPSLSASREIPMSDSVRKSWHGTSRAKSPTSTGRKLP